MAYNLQTLITILEGILDPDQPRWVVDENNPQLRSLLDKATSLQQLVDKSSLTKIDSQIRQVAHQAHDIIESHMVNHMLSGSNCVRFTFSTPDLQQVTRDLDSVIEQVKKLVEMEDKKMLQELDSATEQVKLVEVEDKKMPSSSSSSVVVGIDADLMQLKDRLTDVEKLQIVPIVGMGGVGKTTLARKLYEDPLIVGHFDYRAWTTISQNYNIRQILKSLLGYITGKEYDQHNDELKVTLRKNLFGRRYLVVLDDMWSTQFWDEIKMYFPDNNKGSRIVITTRESGVANYVDSLSLQHQVQLLSGSESWNLLHQLVFREEDCPHVLEVIGRKIAGHCGGLPLAISVIGGLLSKIERSEDEWKKIGKDVKAAIAESGEQCSSILSLSYNHLPNHLKPCCLYMGAYPEDYEIKGSRLVHLWVAEGFVKSNKERSLEEEAKDWLKSLVERNLISVRGKNKYGNSKSYSMHDMMRDVCIRKSDEDKFLHVKNGPELTFSNPRRVSFDISNSMDNVNVLTESMALTRSVIGIGDSQRDEIPPVAFFSSRLLTVLDLMYINFEEFPTEIFEFVNLRFLSIWCRSRIPRGISRLQNLQTLIGYVWFDVSSELWQLSELRNLNVREIQLLKDKEMNYCVLKKLQIISVTTLTREAETWDGFLKSIPNIKKLGIDDGYSRRSTAIDLSHLLELEILRCNYIRIIPFADGSDDCSKVTFPCNIRKLVLCGCEINSRVLGTLCELRKLEVLKISACSFKREEETSDEEWEVAEGDEFPSLQFLYLEFLILVSWIADWTNFPRLHHLRVDNCIYLEEIPSGIGEIPTLQLIELDGCSKSAVASAETIVEEQQSDYENYDLKLSILDPR
ncbi:putative late blight resistance protein homolog R1B-16 [Salvia splendens]|uniref:putative late blight resistance protein homolog R1B-16 n=1 Tax=Salvia splendens TaxID=180675 RepID=UPI001C27B0A9|nr:putative late blight resistance protein homolog R1B-16 [Salvia splendens]XP_042059146.1 putative late blight resistance protein homolog R1B-16 [Salvia splendens]XP_042059147.1 putative late blight resistance protein homolog R1B-16 [Salvia splendens]